MGLFGRQAVRTPGFNPDAPSSMPNVGMGRGGLSGAFERAFNPQDAMGQLGLSLLAGNGLLQNAIPMMSQMRANNEERDWRMQDRARQSEQDAMTAEYRKAQIAALSRAEEPKTPAQVQAMQWFLSQPKDVQEQVRPMMGGYQYTPQGIDAQGQIANARAAASAKYRAPAAPKTAAPKLPSGFILD